MSRHLDLTSSFDTGLKTGVLPLGVTVRDPQEAERRFRVYRNNVAVSLIDALAGRFPVIQRLVGDTFFAAMARVYAETHRPSSPVLIEWGASFPAFLQGFPPLADYPYMPDVARIEWARGVAYHAADAQAADPAIFANADPSTLTLHLHPSVQVLHLSTPAVSIWTANQPGADGASPQNTGAEYALILRALSFDVPVLSVTNGDAILIDNLMTGATLQTAAEMAAWAQTDHTPNEILVRLVQAGAFIDP